MFVQRLLVSFVKILRVPLGKNLSELTREKDASKRLALPSDEQWRYYTDKQKKCKYSPVLRA